jgi:hypothetical protein
MGHLPHPFPLLQSLTIPAEFIQLQIDLRPLGDQIQCTIGPFILLIAVAQNHNFSQSIPATVSIHLKIDFVRFPANILLNYTPAAPSSPCAAEGLKNTTLRHQLGASPGEPGVASPT